MAKVKGEVRLVLIGNPQNVTKITLIKIFKMKIESRVPRGGLLPILTFHTDLSLEVIQAALGALGIYAKDPAKESADQKEAFVYSDQEELQLDQILAAIDALGK